MKVKVEFSGGLELMFDNKKELALEVEDSKVKTLADLIQILRKEHLKDKEEMFIQNNTVRPGIIVLVNDTDWELLETTAYEMQNNDTVAFISTLHGGWL